jgi:hypothetical protein
MHMPSRSKVSQRELFSPSTKLSQLRITGKLEPLLLLRAQENGLDLCGPCVKVSLAR